MCSKEKGQSVYMCKINPIAAEVSQGQRYLKCRCQRLNLMIKKIIILFDWLQNTKSTK